MEVISSSPALARIQVRRARVGDQDNAHACDGGRGRRRRTVPFPPERTCRGMTPATRPSGPNGIDR